MSSQTGCLIPNCSSPHFARGYCNKDYHRLRLSGELSVKQRVKREKCNINGCNKPQYYTSIGLCANHYLRKWIDNGRSNLSCDVPDCDIVVYAKNKCRTHYEQNRKA